MRKLTNNIFQVIFTTGGIAVIIIVFLMLFFLFKEVIPLFYQAKIDKSWSYKVDDEVIQQYGSPVKSILSEHGKYSIIIFSKGKAFLEDTQNGNIIDEWDLEGPIELPVLNGNNFTYKSEQKLINYKIIFLRDSESGLVNSANIIIDNSFVLPFEDIISLTYHSSEDEGVKFAVSSANKVYHYFQLVEENFLGEATITTDEWEKQYDTEITGITFFKEQQLAIISNEGKILVVNETGEIENFFTTPYKVTAYGILHGGNSICLGGENGEISLWAQANNESGDRVFYNIHKLKNMKSAVRGFAFNKRDRTLAAWDENGFINIYYSTTEKLRLTIKANPTYDYVFNPKGDMLMGTGALKAYYKINNPHPDVSFNVLFGKVWYEGYAKKGFAWQSTGGSNEFEAKLSLIPLIFGTLKGALYAMLFALPLAISGAIFLSHFLHYSLHRMIKPVIEIMAGLPSVIIGFLAGLWLAPLLEKTLPGVLLALFCIPLVIITLSALTDQFKIIKNINTYKYEVFILIPFIILVFIICVKLTPVINNLFFNGDYKQFVFNKLNIPYDQRNAVVVGFAMGFAVIPIIFSLAEDALSFVPREIIAGSLALGLSRWQTVTGVVLKAAFPGILSATMIGFGRAVGETMIVLMATGNTPVLSWFPFNGFRTMSANIAVELPETPVGGSAYRILFLTALLLFLFTFVINIITDFIRKKMK